ncbi:TIM-barrel enzyme family protein [Rutstroemia sp. NJR-2017a BBW]|nr:TIM-barrel enzyme family protein [Rutstroemia sp. NJR-2017a BBW]
MTKATTRDIVLGRLKDAVKNKKIIVGAGAGIGLSAKSVEAGGADLIIVYNSGRFRMAGRGSLAGLMPYGDANQVVLEMASEILPIVNDTGVLAGKIRDAAVRVREDVIVLCHGGPVAEVKDVEYVLERTKGIHGFYGASSMERLPVEIAIRDNMKGFKELKVRD